MNTEPSPLNKAETRRLIFARMEVIRPALVGKMSRVGDEVFDVLAARLRCIIDNELRNLPTVGKTIYFR
jgi:hypothetical protein